MYIKSIFIKQFNYIRIIPALLVSTYLLGCSGMGVLENDFGKSVSNMEQSQIYDKNAAKNPSPDAPEGIDGNKSLADLNKLERPVKAEEATLNFIKSKRFEIGD